MAPLTDQLRWLISALHGRSPVILGPARSAGTRPASRGPAQAPAYRGMAKQRQSRQARRAVTIGAWAMRVFIGPHDGLARVERPASPKRDAGYGTVPVDSRISGGGRSGYLFLDDPVPSPFRAGPVCPVDGRVEAGGGGEKPGLSVDGSDGGVCLESAAPDQRDFSGVGGTDRGGDTAARAGLSAAYDEASISRAGPARSREATTGMATVSAQVRLAMRGCAEPAKPFWRGAVWGAVAAPSLGPRDDRADRGEPSDAEDTASAALDAGDRGVVAPAATTAPAFC